MLNTESAINKPPSFPVGQTLDDQLHIHTETSESTLAQKNSFGTSYVDQ